MKSSGRGTRIAVLGYILISVVVLGGMTWATVLSWRLAKLDVVNERSAQTREALWRMDAHLGSILASEGKREYDDFVAIHRPDAIWSEHLDDLDPNRFRQPSPIALYGPPCEWIDLYFQVNQHGVWSSPHLPINVAPWAQDTFVRDDRQAHKARILLERLRATLPLRELEARVNQAMERTRSSVGSSSLREDTASANLVAHRERDALASHNRRIGGEFARRNKAQRRLQQRYVPRPKCLPEDVVEGNILDTSPPAHDPQCECSDEIMSIEVAPSRLAGFWLPSDGEQERRLAFVRTVNVDNQVLHQGFVVDWGQLQQELLAQIEDLFPEADLEPTDPDDFDDPKLAQVQLSQIPATLRLPDNEPIAAALAWRSVRGVLILSWTVALGVLFAAGWGVWNLVALTERRLQFAYAVTHELRTPLTTFRLYSDLLAAGLVPDESRQEYYDTLNRESERLSNLVEDVLEYARLESQQPRFNPVEIESAKLLSTLAESFEERCESCGISARTRNTTPNGKTARTDVDLVRQITGVLVDNACRHARGSSNAAILLELGSENGSIHVDVVDSGPGIDRADARRIFKPFRRGRRAEVSAYGGVGLGLALARSWAALLGGRLQLIQRHHPDYGGAHFRLTLPTELPAET